VVIRLGVVPYLNVAPIIHGLVRDPRFEIVQEVPSRLAEKLHAGEIDVGMIPSIEYAAGDYAIVPGVAIGSRGAVESVRLFHKVPLAEIRSLALDASSRTSVALLRVLLRERLSREPEYLESGPPVEEMLRKADAALVIGDPALYFAGDVESLDLGQEWQERTGLPFVFAFWAGRKGALGRDGVRALQESLALGLGSIPSIASSYNGWGKGHSAQNEAYLRDRIVFELGEAQLKGLRTFYQKAFEARLIPRVPEISFYEHP
jgi:chorismate dehydratase